MLATSPCGLSYCRALLFRHRLQGFRSSIGTKFPEFLQCVCSLIGFLAITAAGLFTAYAIYVKMVLDRSPLGFTAQLTAIVFLAGVQMVFLGVLGEYIGRIYQEVKRRPQFIVCRLSRSGDGS